MSTPTATATIPYVFEHFAFTEAGRASAAHVASKFAAEGKGEDNNNNNNTDSTTTGEGPLSCAEFNLHVRRLLPGRGDRFKDDHHDTCMVIERSKNLNVVAYTANFVHCASEDGGEAVASGEKVHAKPNPHDPLRAYWIKIEPEHVARRRARGEMTDQCELSLIERKLAYGCSVSVLSLDKLTDEVKLSKRGKPQQSNGDGSVDKHAVVQEWFSHFHPCTGKYVATPQWPVLMLTLAPLKGRDDGDGDDANAADPSEDPQTGGRLSFPLTDTVPVMLTVIDGKLSVLSKVFVSSVEPKHFYQLPRVEYIEAFGISLETGEPTYERSGDKKK